ncbi:MAG: hypothetical protein MJ237_03875 [bacterium]|nr:hypothetical protein [bacterium]
MTYSKPKRIITPDNYLKYYYDIPYEGTTSAGKPLRKLKNITCPYRGIKIVPSEALKKFEKGLAETTTAGDAMRLLATYYENMLPTEKDMFAIFSDFSLLNPNDNLRNCLEMIKGNALTRLKLEEFEVLDDVDYLSRKLSPQTALKLRAKTTKCRQIIITNSKHDIFKRKIFLASLEEIIPKENEREIFNSIKNKALFLPTSESSKNAFIVKYSKRSQTEIVRRLFIASTGSIEHVVPASLGGLNTIGNFLYTSASGNRYRENMPLVEYIGRFPQIPIYMQRYIDDIIREIHNGNLQGNETYPYKIKRKLAETSEGRIMISLSKYNYSEEEAAEAVKEFEARWDKYKS